MQAALSWLHLYTAADVKRLNFWLFACLSTEHMNMFLNVFKSTLLSPSKNTRRCATHVGEPCHAARIQLGCSPCRFRHVLENVQRSATRMLRRDGQNDQELDVKKDAGLLAPAIRVQESAKNPSRHGLNDIARVVLQTQKRKNKTSTESRTEQGILQRAECERHMNPPSLCDTEAC